MSYLFHATHGIIYQYPNKFSMMIIWIFIGKNREISGRGGLQGCYIMIVNQMLKSIFPNAGL